MSPVGNGLIAVAIIYYALEIFSNPVPIYFREVSLLWRADISCSILGKWQVAIGYGRRIPLVPLEILLQLDAYTFGSIVFQRPSRSEDDAGLEACTIQEVGRSLVCKHAPYYEREGTTTGSRRALTWHLMV